MGYTGHTHTNQQIYIYIYICVCVCVCVCVFVCPVYSMVCLYQYHWVSSLKRLSCLATLWYNETVRLCLTIYSLTTLGFWALCQRN